MAHWFHHLIFDPLSLWEQTKATLIIAPLALALYVAVAARALRKGKD